MMDALPLVAKAAFAVALVALVIWATCRDLRKQRECEDKGGRVERYNCRWMTSCHTDAHGFTSCTSSESCQWRCVGLPAEDPR